MASNNFLRTFMLSVFILSCLLPPVELSIAKRAPGITTTSTNTEFLAAHNKVRARHSLPPLLWSKPLANYAKWYANQRRGDCKLVHSVLNYGENMFWGMGKRWTPSDAVAAWAAQESYYRYQTNTCMPNKECTHYTQLVWRTTSRVGCAKIKCNNGNTLIICEYDPHGNFIGQRPY